MMAAPKLEIETGPVRIICDLIEERGTLGIMDLVALTGFRDPKVRVAVERGIQFGYLKHGKKPTGLGKRNRRMSFVRTRKRFPEQQAPKPPVQTWSFTPRRDWIIEALFGPYEART